jgi:protein O-mannosyl-transferase
VPSRPLAAKTTLCSVLLFLLAAGAFLPALRNGFVNFDDTVYVYANPHVQGGLSWESMRWAFSNLEAGFWHPLTWLSIMLDCQLFGLRAWGHHLTSLLLHAANTLLLFYLFQRMTGAIWRSAVVAALFALHPLHVEPVAWAASRKDVLCALFWLASMLMYVRYVRQAEARNSAHQKPNQRSGFPLSSAIFYLLSLFFFVCGLMSKTMIVTLPIILLLLDWWPLRRFQLARQGPARKAFFWLFLEKVPFLAAASVGGLLTVLAEKGVGALATAARVPAPDRIANAVLSYVRYLALTVWPRNLAVFYPYPATFSIAAALVALVLLVAVSALAWRASRTRHWLGFGWTWYVVTLLPVIGLIQVGSHAYADRYTYVPLIGIFTLMVWGADDLTRRWRYRSFGLAVGASAVLLLCLVLTVRQVTFWRDTEALMRHALAVTRDNAMAYNNLGAALAGQGLLDEAISFLREAARLAPDDAGVQDNLGAALARQGRMDEAVICLREAVRLNPRHPGAHNDLGAALGQQGRLQEALAELELAVKLAPGDAGAHCNLADALALSGRTDDAIGHYQEAIRLRPDYPEAQNNLRAALQLKAGLPALPAPPSPP